MTLSEIRSRSTVGWRWLRQGAFAAMPLWLRERLRSGRPLTLFQRAFDGSMQIEIFDGHLVEAWEDDIELGQIDGEDQDRLDQWISHRRAIVMLTPPKILVRDVDLPRAAAGNMDEAVGLALHRLSPIVPEALAWTWRLVAIAGDQMRVRTWMVKQKTLDEIEAEFAAAGLLPPSVAAASEEGPVILHEGEDGSRNSEWYRNRRALWLGLAALATIPLTTAIAAATLTQVELAQEEQSADQHAAAMEIVRQGQQASRAREELVAIGTSPSVAEALRHASAILNEPDKITSVRILGGRFVGVTVNTTNRISLLERATAAGIEVGIESEGEVSSVQLEVPLP